MTDSVTYSRPYAEAAYKIAVESNSTSLWADNLMILSEVIKDAEVKAIIASPRVDDKKSLSFLNSFLSKDDTSFSNFLSIMINNKKIYSTIIRHKSIAVKVILIINNLQNSMQMKQALMYFVFKCELEIYDDSLID